MARQPLLVLVLFPLLASGQVPDLNPGAPDSHPHAPTITFTFNRSGLPVEYYAISVESTGRAGYVSRSSGAAAAEKGAPAGEPYQVKFAMSPATVNRVFELAEKVSYFQGDFDYRGHRVADTGTKTLVYADSHQRHDTTYNWSQNQAIQELTRIFQAVSTTLESGRRIAHLRRYDKLGLESELKFLEESHKRKNATELQAIAPVLEQIASDRAVMHIARQRAQRLLEKADTQGSAQR